MRLKERVYLTILLGVSIVTITGCAQNTQTSKSKNVVKAATSEEKVSDSDKAEKELFAMDTYMSVTAYGKNAQTAVDQAAEEIARLDGMLSTGDANSEIAKLNEAGSGALSDDAAYLVKRGLEIGQSTGGVFDIAIYPVMEAWGFPTQEYQVPSAETLAQVLPLTDISNVSFDEASQEVKFDKAGMKIDLGGIAKGYTSSRVIDIFKENGIESGMVNLGGNVQVLGSKTDGSSWKVAVQSPDDSTDYIGILDVKDKAVITSGGYERYFEQDGVTYHHIIDPATGYPAQNGIVSVTIVSEDGTLADALSTSLFIMGLDKASDYWRAHQDEFDAIILTDDKTLYATAGIAESFTGKQEVKVIGKE